jgi:short-subunit dehydrogenase
MIPSGYNNVINLGNVFLKASAAAWTVSFVLWMDCNPSLYWTEKYVTIRERMQGNVHNRLMSVNKKVEVKRTIWIIGASSGIGEELAYQLSSEQITSDVDCTNRPSCLHLLLSSRSQSQLERIAQQCRQNVHCQVTVVPFDVCNEEELRRAVKIVASETKRSNKDGSTTDPDVDRYNNNCNNDEMIVVMNAGCGHLSPALETDSQTAEMIWRRNALWPMILTPLLFEEKLFASSTRPHIVVTSSIGAFVPVPLSACYCAAKHALHGYFRSFQAERPDVTVQLICPGPVETNFHSRGKKERNSPADSMLKENDIDVTQNIQQDSIQFDTMPTTTTTKSPLKMSVQRCARLMMCAMLYHNTNKRTSSSSQQFWIAKQPVLLGLYLEKFLPTSFMDRYVYGMIGTKRVQLFQEGYDLYDPSSWRKK